MVLVVQVFRLLFVLYYFFEFTDFLLDQFEYSVVVFGCAFADLFFDCLSGFESVSVSNIG